MSSQVYYDSPAEAAGLYNCVVSSLVNTCLYGPITWITL